MSGCPSTRWQLALVPQQPGVPRESPSGPPGSPGTGQWTRGRRPARRDGADTAGRAQFGTVRPRTVRWTAAPGRRRRTPRLSKIRRTAEKDRSVSSAIWWSERPASYCSTTKLLSRCSSSWLGREVAVPRNSGSGWSCGRGGYGTGP